MRQIATALLGRKTPSTVDVTSAAGAPPSGAPGIAQTLTLLVHDGVLTPADASRIDTLAAANGLPLARVADRLGLVTPAQWGRAAADIAGLAFVDLGETALVPTCHPRLSDAFLSAHAVIPLERPDGSFVFAVADPFDAFVDRALHLAHRGLPEKVVATAQDIEGALSLLLAASREADTEGFSGLDAEDSEHLRELANHAPTINFVDRIFTAALERGATDIHLEPGERAGRLRLRIDGLLVEDQPIGNDIYAAAVSRLKILAGMDIAERRRPQDGRIRHRAGGRETDVRAATVPTLHGEAVALRLLAAQIHALDLQALAMPVDVLALVEQSLARKTGIVIVTGPTGSGKTTTLHAALSRLNDGRSKIMTVENPVEIRVPGLIQVEARPEIGLDFAAALRAFLRHDPDIMMVGEMRDLETARVAIQAALTGHLVLSTLHTNDAASAVTRLVEMGIEPFMVRATIRTAIAQRLVRAVCEGCAVPAPLEGAGAALVAEFEHRLPPRQTWRLRHGTGCPACSGSGHRGRLAVFEAIGPAEINLALNGTPPASRLIDHGLQLAVAGRTTIEEVIRVVDRGDA